MATDPRCRYLTFFLRLRIRCLKLNKPASPKGRIRNYVLLVNLSCLATCFDKYEYVGLYYKLIAAHAALFSLIILDKFQRFSSLEFKRFSRVEL